jgi:hypothetical protein
MGGLLSGGDGSVFDWTFDLISDHPIKPRFSDRAAVVCPVGHRVGHPVGDRMVDPIWAGPGPGRVWTGSLLPSSRLGHLYPTFMEWPERCRGLYPKPAVLVYPYTRGQNLEGKLKLLAGSAERLL